MIITTNKSVVTPLGDGVVDGFFGVLDAQGEIVVTGICVRLPVNDQTRPELHKSYCMTPHAVQSGVWIFEESELR